MQAVVNRRIVAISRIASAGRPSTDSRPGQPTGRTVGFASVRIPLMLVGMAPQKTDTPAVRHRVGGDADVTLSGSNSRSRLGRPLALTLTCTLAAATIGNSFISKEDLVWLETRRRPRMQISTSAFAVIGLVYYVIMGVVIYRASDRRDSATTRLAVVGARTERGLERRLLRRPQHAQRICGYRVVAHPALAAAIDRAPRRHVGRRPSSVHGVGAVLRPAVDPPALATQSIYSRMIYPRASPLSAQSAIAGRNP
jgi:hypothetical protein